MNDISDTKARPHSIEYFGDERDYFWNRDFLDLLSVRLSLHTIRKIADVGCGVGHWSSLLCSYLAEDSDLIGVDFEGHHVEQYRPRVRDNLKPQQKARAVQANAYGLPFDDNELDAVTCQTLLLHLEHPSEAVREMIRVTRPGGLVLCVEPNNLIGRMPFGSSVQTEPIERMIRLSELAWRYARGRCLLGKGSEMIGEELPGIFKDAGLNDIRTWLCDKATTALPPYDDAQAVAAIKADERWEREGVGPYDIKEFRENVIAGGATEAFFSQAWADFLERRHEIREASKKGSWSMAGGTLFYIVAGRKPV